MPASPLVNLGASPTFPCSPSRLNQSTAKATNRREPSPGGGAGPWDGKIGGRLARTTWALTAIWLGDGHRGRCRTRIQRLLRPRRGRTFHDPFVGGIVGGGPRFRRGGGRGRGKGPPGEVGARVNELGASLARPLAPSGRFADSADDCRRRVGSDASSFSPQGSPSAPNSRPQLPSALCGHRDR